MSIVLSLGGMKAPVDHVRFLANQSSGQLGHAILRAFQDHKLRVRVICGWTEGRLDKELVADNFHEVIYAPTYHEMKSVLLESPSLLGVFAAAVLDFLPEVHHGKLETPMSQIQINCQPTEKLIDLYWKRFCETRLVAFKLESNMTESQLVEKAMKANAHRPVNWIIANRSEDISLNQYRGFLIDLHGKAGKGTVTEYATRTLMAEALVNRILQSKIISYQ